MSPRLIAIAITSALLASCSDPPALAPLAAPPATTVVKDSAPPVPVVPQFRLGYLVESPTTVFSNATLGLVYTTLPAGSQVSVFEQDASSAEIRVSVNGALYKAWVRPGDVIFGDEVQAKEAIQQRQCQKDIGRPENDEMLSGMMFDGKPLVGYGNSYTSDEQFLGLGLEPVEDDVAMPVAAAIATPNRLVIVGPNASDAYVKVKDASGGEIVGFYVHAAGKASVALPDGSFQVYFATGGKFSKSCGKFTENMSVQKDPQVLHLSNGDEVSYELQMRTMPAASLGAFTPSKASLEEFQ